MNKIIKIILYALIIIFIIIQFIPVDLPQNANPTNNDIIAVEEVTPEITRILSVACYDCHSNQVKYPWYSKVAPASWLVARDVKSGIEAMNLSEWGELNKRQKLLSLDKISVVVKSGEMPLKAYTIIHRDAELSDQEREMLAKWAEDHMEKIFEQ